MPSCTTTTRSGHTGPWAGALPAGLQRPGEGAAGRRHGLTRHPLRIRHDKVDAGGTVTLRHDSKLHHIGLGRAHKGRLIKLLVADRDIRVLDARTGELIPRLTLDPSRDYQPIGGS